MKKFTYMLCAAMFGLALALLLVGCNTRAASDLPETAEPTTEPAATAPTTTIAPTTTAPPITTAPTTTTAPPSTTIPGPAPNLEAASTWTHTELDRAFSLGLIPQSMQSQYLKSVTRAEFASLSVALYQAITGRAVTARMMFSDTYDIYVQKAGGLGIMTEIGYGNFAPNDTLNREQAAVILARLAYIIDQPLPSAPPTFADTSEISSWAVSEVGQMQAAGVMGYARDTNFSPRNVLTREESIITVLRLFYVLSGYEVNHDIPTQTAHAVNVPVFMYHTSSEYSPGALAELYVRPSEFARQIGHLVENGFTFVTFDDWHNLHNIYRPVMITFDDGYLANFTEIFPILQRYNARITIFLTTDNITSWGLTREMVREMSDSGLVKFEAHSITHRNFTTLNDTTLTRELIDARDIIEEITGRPVISVAWPAGAYDARVVEFAKRYYQFGVRHMGGMHNTSISDFKIRRLRVSRSTSLSAFINMLGA